VVVPARGGGADASANVYLALENDLEIIRAQQIRPARRPIQPRISERSKRSSHSDNQ